MPTVTTINFFHENLCLELDLITAERRRHGLELCGWFCTILRNSTATEYHLYQKLCENPSPMN